MSTFYCDTHQRLEDSDRAGFYSIGGRDYCEDAATDLMDEPGPYVVTVWDRSGTAVATRNTKTFEGMVQHYREIREAYPKRGHHAITWGNNDKADVNDNGLTEHERTTMEQEEWVVMHAPTHRRS